MRLLKSVLLCDHCGTDAKELVGDTALCDWCYQGLLLNEEGVFSKHRPFHDPAPPRAYGTTYKR